MHKKIKIFMDKLKKSALCFKIIKCILTCLGIINLLYPLPTWIQVLLMLFNLFTELV